MIATLASWSITAARSFSAPSTLSASAALARPGPIALASSNPLTAPGKRRTEPSGSVTATGEDFTLTSLMAWDLAEGERGGNLLHPERREARPLHDSDLGTARRRQGRIGGRGVEHRRRCAGRDEEMHRTGIVSDRPERAAAQRGHLRETGLAHEIARRGANRADRGPERTLGRTANHDGHGAA